MTNIMHIEKFVWPPVQLRRKGERYEEGALRYGYGSPMLSVDAGKQLVVRVYSDPCWEHRQL